MAGERLRARVLAKASAPGGAAPDRFRLGQQTALAELLAEGVVMEFNRPALGGLGRAARRYFTDPAAGRRWVAEAAVAPRRVARAAKLRDLREQSEGKAWRNLKRAEKDAPREVQVSPTVKITKAKTVQFDPRFQCDPAQRIAGGFAEMGMGRYLDGVA